VPPERKRHDESLGTYDPPWRSIPEGRGLPRTAIIKAMLPVLVVGALGVLVVVLVAAGLSELLG
jgi:hypothetical protein